jgi:hypothetical protein
MTSMRVRCLMAVPLLLGSFLSACFTEVGNPEEEVGMTAQVRVSYEAPDSASGPDSVNVSTMRLRFIAADYAGADSVETALWPSRAGDDLDFILEESLPRVVLAYEPRHVGVRLGSSLATATGTVAGTYRFGQHGESGGNSRRFRFALPDTLEFSLRYDSLSLAAWKNGGEYDCRVVFLARRWLSVAGLDTATVSMDSEGLPVVIFDAQNNADLHKLLLQRFSHAFNGPREYAAAPSTP